MTMKLTPEDLPKGTQLGSYRILSRIAVGGHSAVYKAQLAEQLYTVKVSKYRPGERGSESWRLDERFRQEIAVLEQLRNTPNITHVLAHDRHPEGFQFYVQELIEGGENILQWAGRNAPSFVQIAKVFSQLGRALAEIHRRDIIHRDLKPANILMTPQGIPIIIDFGLATCYYPEDLTPPNSIPGTVAYMSPECCAWLLGKRGRKQREVPLAQLQLPTRDLYTLGIVLYQVLTGEHPFKVNREQGEILHDIAFIKPSWPSRLNPDIPAPMSDVVMHLLERDPNKRCQSGNDLAAALTKIAAAGGRAWDVTLQIREQVPTRGPSEDEPASQPVAVKPWVRARAFIAEAGHRWRDIALAGIFVALLMHYVLPLQASDGAGRGDANLGPAPVLSAGPAGAPTGDDMPTTPNSGWVRPQNGSCDHVCPKDGSNMRLSFSCVAMNGACWKVGKPIVGNACDKGWFRAPPEAPSIYMNACFKPVESEKSRSVEE